LFKTCGFFSP
jgi:hypothetical protein